MSSAIHFFHANGFPAETYSELFNNLNGQVVPPIRILGENKLTVDEGYNNIVDEVIEHASKTKGEGVAIGHSLGATLSLLAEARQPGLFKTVILLDPPLFSRTKMIMGSILRRMGLLYMFTPAKKSMKRRESFSSREEAMEYFSSKALFKDVPQSTIELYVKYALAEIGGEYRLVISRERETEIYLNIPSSLPNEISRVQGYLIYADKVRLLDDVDLEWWKKAMPNISRSPFHGSHMFPFEKPKELADFINNILDSLN
tara:strand:+ start:1824 stop:2597 length:774 start_codon:yes stop_codon:yes gene_type:complete